MQEPENNLFQGMMELGLLGSSLKQVARSRKTKKGTPDRRVIKRFVKDGREHYLHATKGWKSRRL